MSTNDIHSNVSPASDLIAIHLLRALTRCVLREEAANLEDLAREVGVRKADARQVLSALDRQGFVDVLRMRPTLIGFSIGQALVDAELRDLREVKSAAKVQGKLAA